MIHRRAFTLALLVLSAAPLRAQSTQPLAPDSYKQLKFRYIGPVGNRVIAIVGVPGNPNIYYAGAASGGIFKTTDNRPHCDAIFDDQPVSSIGSLAIAPSDPNVARQPVNFQEEGSRHDTLPFVVLRSAAGPSDGRGHAVPEKPKTSAWAQLAVSV